MRVEGTRKRAEDDPHLAWANSGAMCLTGTHTGPPLLAPAPLATAAHAALLAFRTLAGEAWRGGELDGAALLGERAAIFGLERNADAAPGGSCRLLPTRGGWLAVNLARESDREMLPAWLEADLVLETSQEVNEASWSAIGDVLATRDASHWLERARWMGLPVAEVPEEVRGANGRVAGVDFGEGGRDGHGPARGTPRVLDLSGLWAGPLCGALLAAAGACVVKCESAARPDGARRGPADFFDLLNAGKRSVALPFETEAGRRRLAELIEAADIVIESARPRALRGLGFEAEAWIADRPGRTWISITGYGREEPEAHWVAFGDDAAAASGLAWATARANGCDAPLFCGDAIADPLAGLHAAVFALANYQRGSSRLIALSLRGVVASLLEAASQPPFALHYTREGIEAARGVDAQPPAARDATSHAASLGADTQTVLDEWGVEG